MDRLTALQRTERNEKLAMIAKLGPDERAEQARRPEFAALLQEYATQAVAYAPAPTACATQGHIEIDLKGECSRCGEKIRHESLTNCEAKTAGDHEDVAKDELKARNWNVAILPADTELVVMTKCDKMLSKLKSSAQLRVIEWLDSRLRERFGSDGPQNG